MSDTETFSLEDFVGIGQHDSKFIEHRAVYLASVCVKLAEIKKSDRVERCGVAGVFLSTFAGECWFSFRSLRLNPLEYHGQLVPLRFAESVDATVRRKMVHSQWNWHTSIDCVAGRNGVRAVILNILRGS